MAGSDGAAAVALGRVLQVNVSPGGVPKLPVDEAYVNELGLTGDRHHDDTEHGGPHRAVSLFALEAIRRVQAEGHPIAPGTAGENLTTEGLELAHLPVGTRLAIGERLVLELSQPDGPCKTIARSFSDGNFNRISILKHPGDSRMYARVLRPGTVRAGDRILVLPPAPESTARLQQLLDLLEAVERSQALRFWHGVREAGHELHILASGELAVAAAPTLPQPIFSSALGMRQLPNLLGRVLDFYRQHGAIGWIAAGANEPPWPGAAPERTRAVLVAPPGEVEAAPAVPGLEVRTLGPNEGDRWVDIVVADWNASPELARAFRDGALASLRSHDHFLLGAELEGELVGVGRLHIRRGAALMGSATVLPQARGQGVHRALIAARAALAADHGCEWLGGHAVAGSVAERNLLGMGLRPIWARADYRFDPLDADAPRISEAPPVAEPTA